jgi:hypothetical protein
VRLNFALGEFHSLIQWLIVLRETMHFTMATRQSCLPSWRGFVRANTDADLAAHSFEMVLKIASALQKPSRLAQRRSE